MIRLSFNGALSTVGASAVVVDTRTEKIVLDYGTKIQEIPPKFPLPVDGKPDAIIATHCHLDHSGALATFFTKGNSCPVYAINVTRPLTELLLRDSIKISREEGIELPFTKADVKETIKNFLPINYRAPFKIHKTEVTCYDAGHIPGSLMAFMKTGEKNILYTGDFKTTNARLLKKADQDLPEIDILITESTYSDREHPDRKSQERQLVETINDTLAVDGVCLIAGFAVGRIDEILLALNARGIDYPVYVDGMAKKGITIINQYKKLLREPNSLDRVLEKVEYVASERMRRRIIRQPCVILTTSGMCVHPDTYVQLSDGLSVPIAETESPVFSFNFRTGKLSKDLCIKKYLKPSPEFLYEIGTSTGTIKVTPDHKFFIINDLNFEEREASKLKKGDRIAYIKRIPFTGRTQPIQVKIGEWCSISNEGLRYIRAKRSELKLSQKELGKLLGISQGEISAIELGRVHLREKSLDKILETLKINSETFKEMHIDFKTLKTKIFDKVKIPTKTTPELCQLLGYFLGDGDVHQGKEIRLTDKDVENLLIYKNLAKKVFGIEGNIKKVERNRLLIHSTVAAKFIGELIKGGSRTRKIPEIIQQSSLEDVAAFLRGLFDAEGTVYTGTTNYTGISSVSKDIVHVAQLLLLRFGIVSKLQDVFNKKAYGKKAYYLTIYHPECLKRFAEKIGFSGSAKAKKMNKLLSKLKFSWSHLDILPISKSEIYCHLKKFFKRIPRSRELNIWKNCKESLTLRTLEKLLGTLENHKNKINDSEFSKFVSKLKHLYNSDITWTKILKIKKFRSDTKFVHDLGILTNQTYTANGFIVHNCSGGPIVQYIKKLYDDRNCSLVLTSFQVEGTPGKTLLETGRYINEKAGLNLELKMFVKRLDFSSHCGRSDLFNFAEKVDPEKIFCIHGDHTEEFASELREKGFDAVAPLANNRIFVI